MARSRIRVADWFDYPQYYDIAFQAHTRREADFIEAACRKYCPFAPRRFLEPGCGSGRLITELAARGYQVTGFDLSQPALTYLRRRVARRLLHAETFEAQMSNFRLGRPVDAAYCTVNTFRHLLTEQSACGHLKCVAGSLRRGGIYLLGLHLLPLGADPEDNARWTQCR
jgi:SAM-dependent methyltransferase